MHHQTITVLAQSWHSKKALISETIWISVFAFIGSLWLFSSILLRFTTVTAAQNDVIGMNDSYQNVWMLWWTAHALEKNQSPFQTELLFYPLPTNLFWQTLQVTHGLIAAPVTLLFGPIAAYNVVAIASFVLSAVTMYWLARLSGNSPFAAGVAAMIYSFMPFHVSKLYDGQLEMASIQYFPLLTIGLLCMFADQKRRLLWIGINGLIIIWIMFTSWYYGLFSLIYTPLVGFWMTLVDRTGVRVKSYYLCSTFGCLVLPGLVILANIFSLPSYSPDESAYRMFLRSAQVLDFFLPSPHHPLWGEWVREIQIGLHGGAGMINISLGVLIWPLVVIGLVACRRLPMYWFHLALALSFMVLAMGPRLVWNGQQTDILLPFGLISHLPGVQVGQRPNHFVVVAAVHLSVLAAAGIDTMLRWQVQQSVRASIVIVTLIIVDLLPMPVSGAEMQLSPAYKQILRGSGAIFEVPFQMDSAAPLLAQITHQRPIMGGYLARTPDYPFVNSDGVYTLWTGRIRNTILSDDWLQALVEVMQAQQIEYVIAHYALLSPSQRTIVDRLSERLEIVYQDRETVLYRLTDAMKPRVTFAFDRGWHELERDSTGQRWQWMARESTTYLFNGHREPRLSLLTINLMAGMPQQHLTLTLLDHTQRPVTAVTLPVSPSRRSYSFLVNIPSGVLQLRLVADRTLTIPNDSRELAIVVQGIKVVDVITVPAEAAVTAR
ncbi:MAG: DUF2079 domain-containing protein [Chloroflexus sp.]|nr:DUF2079 domain-containing protein [Chloroflexus sp.]